MIMKHNSWRKSKKQQMCRMLLPMIKLKKIIKKIMTKNQSKYSMICLFKKVDRKIKMKKKLNELEMEEYLRGNEYLHLDDLKFGTIA